MSKHNSSPSTNPKPKTKEVADKTPKPQKKYSSLKYPIIITLFIFFMLCLLSTFLVSATSKSLEKTIPEKPDTTQAPSPTHTPTKSPNKTFVSSTSQFSIELPPCFVTQARTLIGYSEIVVITSRSNLNIPQAILYVSSGSNAEASQKKITSNYQIIGRKEASEIKIDDFSGIVEKFVSTDKQQPQRLVASVSNGEITITIDGQPTLVSEITNQLTFN